MRVLLRCFPSPLPPLLQRIISSCLRPCAAAAPLPRHYHHHHHHHPSSTLSSRLAAGSHRGRVTARRMNKSSSRDLRDRSSLDTCNYGDASYWDKRYSRDPSPFDWYQTYSTLAPMIRNYVPTCGRVLIVGCGNASLSEDMVADGYEDLVNIDISHVVIDAMQKKYYDVPQLKYLQMDVQDLSFFDDGTFDAVIDKGTLDSLMCGTNATYRTGSMLAEVSRTLKPGGVFILITYGDTRSRLPHLIRKEYCWTISLYVIPAPGSKRALEGCSNAYYEPALVYCNESHATTFTAEDNDSHFVYICRKVES